MSNDGEYRIAQVMPARPDQWVLITRGDIEDDRAWDESTIEPVAYWALLSDDSSTWRGAVPVPMSDVETDLLTREIGELEFKLVPSPDTQDTAITLQRSVLLDDCEECGAERKPSVQDPVMMSWIVEHESSCSTSKKRKQK